MKKLFTLTTIIIILCNIFSIAPSYAQLNGAYTINPAVASSATNYLSFNAADSDLSLGARSDGGAVNGPGVSGAVTFTVSNSTYNGQLIIPLTEGTITGASATNTITFDGGTGNAANVIVTSAGSSTNYATLTFNGCQYVNFKNITINNTVTGNNGWGVNFFANTMQNNYNLLVNCIINVPPGSSTNQNLYGVMFNGSYTTPGTAFSTTVSYCTISGCTVNNGYTGVYLYGFNNGNSTENVVSNNTLYGAYQYGILTSLGATAFKIRGNRISCDTTTNIPPNFQAIKMLGVTSSSSSDYAEISGNTIYHFTEIGIAIQASPGSAAYPTQIFNNFIGGGILYSPNPVQLACIYATSSTGYIDVWNNTLLLNMSGTTTSSAAMQIGSSSNTNWDIEDNIFSYTGASNTQGQPFYSSSGTLVNSTFNYNIFYNPTNTNLEATVNGTAYSNTTLIGGDGFNTNSQVTNPNFVNTSQTSPDLDITSQCPRGIQIPSVTTDIHGTIRNNPPCIGADELTLTNKTIDTSSCTGASLTLKVSGGTSYNWSTGSNADSIVITVSKDTMYTVIVGAGSCGSFTDSVYVNVIKSPPLIIKPPSATFCSGLNISLKVISKGSGFEWSPSTGLSATTGDSVLASPTISTTYTVTGIDSLGCAASGTEEITVIPSPNKPTFKQNGDTLISSSFHDNQWYRNDTLLTNDTSRYLIITSLGEYWVIVNNEANGCSTSSDSVRIDSVTGIDQLSVISNQLSIYPNPTGGQFFLTISSSVRDVRDWNLQITDVLGRTVYIKQPLNYNNDIDIFDLPKGIYFIKVINKSERAVLPVVKQN